MHDQWRESQMKININDNYYYMRYDDDDGVCECEYVCVLNRLND